jgi:hypothetical protein
MQKLKTFWYSHRNLIILGLWTTIATILAYRRSMWGDEWVRFTALQDGIISAVKAILNEPSPFIPGEAVLNGLFKIILVPFKVPKEIWARAQEIGWGVATLSIALDLSNKDRRERYLPWFIAFSVALISLSTQMRPYASLFCSGAIATKIFIDGGIKGRPLSFLTFLFMLTGHLYGICFIILSLFLTGQIKKEILKVLTGLFMVGVVLFNVKILKGQGGVYSHYNFIQVMRETLGTLSNPHKAIVIFFPLFIWGFYKLNRENKILSLKFVLLFIAAVIGPILATIFAKYFFVSRQIVGGAFPFLFLASAGLSEFSKQLKYQSISFAVCILISVVPWTLSVLLKIPPFVDQPMHRYREVGEGLVRDHRKNILDVDTCNVGPLKDYIENLTSEKFLAYSQFTEQGYALEKSCLPSGLCITRPTDWIYCSVGPWAYKAGGVGFNLVSQTQYDTIVHSLIEPFPKLNSAAEIIRAW